MTESTDNKINLYISCINAINKLYEEFKQYDKSVNDCIIEDIENISSKDLCKLLDILGYSETRITIIRELEYRENIKNHMDERD